MKLSIFLAVCSNCGCDINPDDELNICSTVGCLFRFIGNKAHVKLAFIYVSLYLIIVVK